MERGTESSPMGSIPEIEDETRRLDIGPDELAKLIDHTNLSPYVTEDSIGRLCEEAALHGFYSVCVNSFYAGFCDKRLEDEDVLVDVVVGFPLGQTTSKQKAYEASRSVKAGADEIDMVMNVGAFRDGRRKLVKDDVKAVVDASRRRVVKVIIEAGYLTYEEIAEASELVKEAGADFVKNSTGFGPYGANIPQIRTIREAVGVDMGVKAAGEIHDFRDAFRMIAAGADRIGTSAGVRIMETYRDRVDTDWFSEEKPCDLCPSRMVEVDDVPGPVFRYYKDKCVDCPYGKYRNE